MLFIRANAAAVVGGFAAALLTLSLGIAGAPDDTVTWAVRPRYGGVADGRTRIDVDFNPGEEIVEHLIVTNLGDVLAEFALSAADGYFMAQGRFTMLAAGEESTDAGT